MHYTSHADYAFNSVGASLFFMVVYVHIMRGLYYGLRRPREMVWFVGIIIFFAMVVTAFMGYIYCLGDKCVSGVQQL